jgi:hypothetical protein
MYALHCIKQVPEQLSETVLYGPVGSPYLIDIHSNISPYFRQSFGPYATRFLINNSLSVTGRCNTVSERFALCTPRRNTGEDDLDTRWKNVLRFMPLPRYARGKVLRCPVNKRRELQGWSGRFREEKNIFTPAVNRTSP